jgi:beta-lactamase class A
MRQINCFRTTLCGALLGAMIFCGSVFSQTPASGTLRQQIEQHLKSAPGRIGVALKYLETGESAGWLENEKFPMQSVYKFPIGMAVLHHVDQRRLTLNQPVVITPADYVGPGQHSPIRDQHPKGVTLTVREILRYAVSESDGSASDVLLRLIGGPQSVMKYLQQLQVTGLNVLSTEKEIGQQHSVQYDNWAQPLAAVSLLEQLQQGRGLSKQSQKLLLHLMTNTPTGLNRIKGLLPAGTPVAHKTGTSGTKDGVTAATNDIGVVTLPNGQHFAIAVFVSDATGDIKVREEIIAKTARIAWDYWTRNNRQ